MSTAKHIIGPCKVDKTQSLIEAYREKINYLEKINIELLESLKEIAAEEWRDDDDPILDRARCKARAAIAKAEWNV